MDKMLKLFQDKDNLIQDLKNEINIKNQSYENSIRSLEDKTNMYYNEIELYRNKFDTISEKEKS